MRQRVHHAWMCRGLYFLQWFRLSGNWCVLFSPQRKLKSLGDFQNVLYSVSTVTKNKKRYEWRPAQLMWGVTSLLTSHPDWNKLIITCLCYYSDHWFTVTETTLVWIRVFSGMLADGFGKRSLFKLHKTFHLLLTRYKTNSDGNYINSTLCHSKWQSFEKTHCLTVCQLKVRKLKLCLNNSRP